MLVFVGSGVTAIVLVTGDDKQGQSADSSKSTPGGETDNPSAPSTGEPAAVAEQIAKALEKSDVEALSRLTCAQPTPDQLAALSGNEPLGAVKITEGPTIAGAIATGKFRIENSRTEFLSC